MKKFAFSLVLVFLSVFLFAQTTSDYDKILKGDLSAFAGYWLKGNNYKNDNNNRVFLRSDGSALDSYYRAGGYGKTEGVYKWGVFGNQDGFYVMLFPIGVDIAGIETDKTRVRIYFAYTVSDREAPSHPENVYYKESAFPATHVTSENLRLREWNDLNSKTIKILEKGTMVLLAKWGDLVSVDGNSARWARVYTSDGFDGWCYSGYLEEIRE